MQIDYPPVCKKKLSESTNQRTNQPYMHLAWGESVNLYMHLAWGESVNL